MKPKQTSCPCKDSESVCSSANCTNRITIKRERSIPPLSYEILEGNLKHLQGQVLTVLEASISADKLTAAKSLTKGFFNDKLTHLFDMCLDYGLVKQSRGMPDYVSEDIAEYSNGASLES